MNHKNCANCEHARSDIMGIFSFGSDIHCRIYNGPAPWYYAQHLSYTQVDLIKDLGCGSFKEANK